MKHSQHSYKNGVEEKTPIPRRIPFDFPSDMDVNWHPSEPEFEAMINGMSLTMPYLEPFLIRTMIETVKSLENTEIKDISRAFNTQEQNHYQTHRRFNDFLKENKYPELRDIELAMEESYSRLAKRSLRTRMAYTAGFEAMTLGLTKWLVENRVKLFTGADSRVASFVLWHMVEEVEHKCVAFDVYQSAFGNSFSSYLARAIGVFHGSFDVIRFSRRGYRSMLKKQQKWYSLSSRLNLALQLGGFVKNVGPFLLRATLPTHNPRHEIEPEWVKEWIDGYKDVSADYVPLIDTSDSVMPVPFSKAA